MTTPGTTVEERCEGCGGALPPPPRRGKRQKWCSDRCRKQTLYAGTCEVCGATTNGYGGPGTASNRCIHHSLQAERRRQEALARQELVVELRRVGLTDPEIAARSGFSVTAVRGLLQRARASGMDVPRAPYFTRATRARGPR